MSLTPAEELIVRELYANKHTKRAYCTNTVPLTFRRWNGTHPVDANTTVEIIQPGTTLKIVMVSRFDDCGLTDDLSADNGYHCRVSWDSGQIENIRWTP